MDTVYPASARADSEVRIFLPVPSAGLGPGRAGSPVALAPVTVRDYASGRLVRYTVTYQGFGSWSRGLEFAWNYARLQTLFLSPAPADSARGLPDTAGLADSVGALYAATGDRFTTYTDSSAAAGARQALLTTTRDRSLGLLLQAGPDGDTILVEMVAPQSPAARAGLARGDKLLTVNGQAVTGDSAVARIIPALDAADPVTLDYFPARGGGIREVTMAKEPVDFPGVLADSLDGLGYIAVFRFSSQTLPGSSTLLEFRAALEATRAYPATLLDLRGNPGGSVDQAVEMADDLIAAGPIIRQEQRQWDADRDIPMTLARVYTARSGGAGEGRRFVLLADGGSASASEIFLSAVREALGCPLVGTRTYGKGIGQVVFDTPAGGLAKITSLRFRSRDDHDYQRVGLAPTDSVGGDAWLALARAEELGRQAAGLPLAKAGAGGREPRLRLREWDRRQARSRAAPGFEP